MYTYIQTCANACMYAHTEARAHKRTQAHIEKQIAERGGGNTGFLLSEIYSIDRFTC